MVKVLAIAAVFALVCAIVMLTCFDPATSGLFPTCPFYYLTGLHCPGCGTLRALHRLLHFNFIAALAMNPLTVMSLPFVSYGLASAFLETFRGKGLPRMQAHPAWIWALCLFVILFGITRNLPIYPFDQLAPGVSLQ
jgi:hypothetical protein